MTTAEATQMNLLEINKRIKQRPPFQMIERVTEWEANVYAKGIKCVSVNEPYFAGHFPGVPIMPGVLIEECAAQLCSLVIDTASMSEEEREKLYVLLKVKDFKFLKPVIPGDKLEIEARTVMASSGLYEFTTTITVDGVVKAKGNMLFTAIDKSAIYG